MVREGIYMRGRPGGHLHTRARARWLRNLSYPGYQRIDHCCCCCCCCCGSGGNDTKKTRSSVGTKKGTLKKHAHQRV